MSTISTAIMLAKEAHKSQFRKYGHSMDAYIMHPMRVAGLVSLSMPLSLAEDQEVMAAAWLHDVLEDTDWTAETLLDADIPARTIAIVQCLTRPKSDQPRVVRFNDLLEKMKEAPWTVRLIKLADRCDNLHDSVGDLSAPPKWVAGYASESLALLQVLKGTCSFLEAHLESLINQIISQNPA